MVPGGTKHVALIVLYLIWAIPWCIIAVAGCFTIVGIFLFPMFVALGVTPLNNEIKRRIKEVRAYRYEQQRILYMRPFYSEEGAKYLGQRWD